MIKSYSDYLDYIKSDQKATGYSESFLWLYVFTTNIGVYLRLLRKLEYYHNCKRDILSRTYRRYLSLRFRRLSIALGYSIPLNVFGPGLSLAHRGTIVVNTRARVGSYCRLHVCVNIGEGADGKAPLIGDNCYIGPGAKLFGGIVIGDNVAIGANAVVNQSFPEGNMTIAGIPARKISDKNSLPLLKITKE